MVRGPSTRPRRSPSVSMLLALLLVLVLAPILVLQTRVYRRSYEARRAEEERAGLEVARAVAASFDAFVAALRTEARTAGQGLVLLAPFARSKAMWYLARLKQARPEVVSVSWLQPNGLVFASSDASLVRTMWPEGSWRRDILHGRDFVVTGVTPRHPVEGRFWVFQGARDRTKTLRGIIVLVVDPRRLQNAIEVRRSGQGGTSLVDSRGWLVSRFPALPPDEGREWGRTFSSVRRALAGHDATGSAPAPSGTDRWIVAAVPVPSVGWAAAADRPERAALAPIQEDITTNALIFALVVALGALLASIAARTITAPLHQLRTSARAIGSTPDKAQAPVGGPAEVADLGRALNRMAEEIRQRERAQEGLLAEVQHQRALLETVLQHVNYGVVAIDAVSRRVLLRNDSFERITGQPLPPGARCAQPPRAWRHAGGSTFRPADWPPVRVLAEGDEIIDEEIEYLPPEGPKVTLLANAAPVRDARGRVTAAVVTLHDISERKQAEADRTRLQAQLVAAERARAELAETLNAEISHRTTNNLAMVAGLLQMQIAQEPDATVVATLQDAIARLYTFAGVHRQLGATAHGEIELLGALRRLAGSLQEIFREAPVVLTVDGDEASYHATIGTNLCLVANELITNAIKHGAPGPDGHLQVKVRLARAQGRLHFTVWNSGPLTAAPGEGRRRSMGMDLVEALVVSQYQGAFRLEPHAGGALASVLLSDAHLRQVQ